VLNFCLGLAAGWTSGALLALVLLVVALRHMRHVDTERQKLKDAAARLAGERVRS